MKLYYPKSHYSKTFRGLVFPLLKSFIKGRNFTDAQRMELYGLSETDFEFTEILEEADVAILTMAWNYYIITKQEAAAISFVEQCASLSKKVLAYNAGDFGLRIPHFENLIEFRAGGYLSKLTENQYTIPPFIADPLKKYYHTHTIMLRPYKSKPVIGFCGQANPSRANAAKEVFKILIKILKYYTAISREEPQQLLSTSFLRASVLKKIQCDKAVENKFILRDKYRAGITKNKDTHETTHEFYNNLRDSDYGICIRGTGNFSVRFYETLAMGRVPVLINTDCSLPLNDEIDWRKHVVWVDYNEREQVAQKVNWFHDSLSEAEFLDLQQSNRKLWMEKLSLKGYFKHFFLKFETETDTN